jgi:predicted RND superfamily exporter protein
LAPYALYLLKLRYVVLVVLVAVSIYFCLEIRSLEVRVNADAILPQTHPFVTATNRIEALFGGKNQVIVGIVPRSRTVYDPAELASMRRITERLLLVPGVIASQVLSLTAAKAKAIIGSEAGLKVRPLVQDEERPGTIKQLVHLNPVYRNSIVSNDGSIGVILADFRQNRHWTAYRSLFKAVRDSVEPERTEERRIVLAGIAVSLAWLEIYSQQMLWLFFVALVRPARPC